METWTRILWLVPVLMVGCSGTRPSNLGLKEGRLAPCPNSPNCVSTQSTDAKHGIDPIVYTTSREEARDRLEKIVRAMPRTKVVRQEEDYMHLECSSRLLRFVDDVEFWFDDANKVIHCRSASRKGYSDLGVNRKRVEQIREQFNAAGQGG
jgi:uncharacterized protein (DUF1499 family)